MTLKHCKNSDSTIFNDTKALFDLSKSILLKGPADPGKTKLTETLSEVVDTPMRQVNYSIDLDTENLLGLKTIKISAGGQQEVVFVNDPIIKAMKEEHILYIDEVDMTKPETLPVLDGVLGYRRQITSLYTGEVIKAVPGFNIIAAINEGYVGTLPMNEALKNRFVVIHIDYIDEDILKSIVKEQSLLQDGKQIEQIIKFNKDSRTMSKQGRISEETVSICALLGLYDLITAMPVEHAIKRTIIDKLEDEREQQAIYNAVELNF